MRIRQHFLKRNSGAILLTYAINKHGEENFYWGILEKTDNLQKMLDLERYWINKLNTLSPNGYNISSGGIEGMTELNLLRGLEVRCINTGQEFSSMSEAARATDSHVGSIGAICNGKSSKTINGLSFEFMDEKRREAAKICTENRLIWSKQNKINSIKRMKILQKESINSRKIPIRCIDTGIAYESATEAARQMSLRQSKISRCCSGDRDSTGGFCFEYLDLHLKSKASEKKKNRKIEGRKACLENIKNLTEIKYKPIQCVETGIIYKSPIEAATLLGLKKGNISAAIYSGGTTGGFHFIKLITNKENKDGQ